MQEALRLGSQHDPLRGSAPVVGAFFLVALATAAGLPYRLPIAFGPFPSVATLDLVLLAAGVVLLWNWLLVGTINLGDRVAAALLSAPLIISAISLLWTHDVAGTLRSIILSLECMVAYLIVVELGSRQARIRSMRQIQYLLLLLIVPGVLMLLRVPGFSPQVIDADETSLMAYYGRFGHPFLGKSNDLAGVLAFLLFLLSAWAVVTRRFLDVLMAALCAIALTATLSRGVLLAVALAVVGVAFTSVKGFLVISLLTVAFVSATALFLGYLSEAVPIVGAYLEDRLSFTNVEARGEILDVALLLITDRPALGVGAGAGSSAEAALSAGVHNTFLEQILSFGIPLGTLVGVALIALPLRVVWIKGGAQEGLVFRKAVVAALGAQLLTFLTQTSFEASIPRILFYILVGYSILLVGAPADDRDLREPHVDH